ncbi:hypothetical protein C8J57DRAFT_1514047 [Mycena rebaudengoi]|nr:hypothetical protein C8J57DRAFT_1514047 [Mycena rebaudengoi]
MDRITEGLVLVSTPTLLSAPNLKYGLQVPPKPFLAQASELSILGSELFKRRDGLDVPRRQIRRHPRSPPDFSPPCSRSIAPLHPDLGPDARHLHTVSSTLRGATTAAAAFGAPRSPAGFPPLVLAHPLDPDGDMCSVSNGLKTASSRGFGRQRFGTLALPA